MKFKAIRCCLCVSICKSNFLVKAWKRHFWIRYTPQSRKEFDFRKTCVAKFNDDQKPQTVATKFLSDHCEELHAMPAVHLALKLAVTLGATTAMCESFFCSQKHYARSQAINEAHFQYSSYSTCF